MTPLVRFALGRVLLLPLMLLILVTLSFGLVALIPGDPATLILGDFAGPEELAVVRAKLGLDDALIVQYGNYLGSLVQGDFGRSYLTDSSIGEEMLRRLPNSLAIIVPSLVLAVGLGTLMGAIGGYFRRRWPDKATNVAVTAIQGVPPFFLALVMIYLFVFEVRLFPTPIGMLDATTAPPPDTTGILIVDAVITWSPDVLASIATHAILPTISVGIFLSAYFAKTVRTAMTQALASPQVEFARACGLPERQVVRYAFLSARTAVLTYLAIMLGVMFSAVAIIELVFAWPGAGAWALDGILKGDLPVIQGFIVVTGGLVIVSYLVLDVVVALLDPRISY